MTKTFLLYVMKIKPIEIIPALFLLLLSLSFTTEAMARQCGKNIQSITTQLELKYQKEIKNLLNTKPYFKNKITCKVLSEEKDVIALFYNDAMQNNDVNHSLILATINTSKTNNNKQIVQDYFYKDIIHNNANQYEIKIDSESYSNLSSQKPLGITLFYQNNYILKSKLFIFEPKGKTFRVLLEGIETDRVKGYDDKLKSSLLFNLKKIPNHPLYSPLIFNREYTFSQQNTKGDKIDRWTIKVKPAEYIYKGSKYQEKSNQPVFDLEKIIQQSKQGFKFKPVIIKAMIFEYSPIFDKNKKNYLEITRNFNESKQFEQSILILNELLSQDSESPEAHLNLGNAYWGLKKKYKASLEYSIYVNQKKVKEEKPLKIALRRTRVKKSIFTQNIEGTFKEVHTNTQNILPLELTYNHSINKDVTPLEVKPWLQKTLLTTSKGELLKAFAYNSINNKNIELNFLFFLKILDENGQYFIDLYKFTEKSKQIKQLIRIPIDSFIASNSKYLNNNHVYQNFHLEDDTLYFYIIDKNYNDAGELEKKFFEFKLKTEQVTELYTSNKDKEWFLFPSHDRSAVIENDSRHTSITLTYLDKLKNTKRALLEIKNTGASFEIGDINWSKDKQWIYFDNHGEALACIWRYNLTNKTLSKIVPEHEAEHPYSFSYKGVVHIIYIEGQSIKLARPSK